MNHQYLVEARASENSNSVSLRVNDRDASIHPKFHDRWEAQENGLSIVDFAVPIPLIRKADVLLEMWGGHPGTQNKTVSVNGRQTYSISDPASSSGQCSYTYPRIGIAPRDLVQGANALQFVCERGTSFWGHFMLDDVGIRGELQREDAIRLYGELVSPDHEITVSAFPTGDTVEILLMCRGVDLAKIASVDYLARYRGYDESGSRSDCAVHGYTRSGVFEAHVGTATTPPFELNWDTHMLSTQRDEVEIIARVNLVRGLHIAVKSEPFVLQSDSEVDLVYCTRIPVPFWSRANRVQTANFDLPCGPEEILEARLYMRVWDGGEGSVSDPITLNDCPVTCLDGTAPHRIKLISWKVPDGVLRRGLNELRVLSDTEHHGLEIPDPGPGLLLKRSKRVLSGGDAGQREAASATGSDTRQSGSDNSVRVG